jgi:hypothetical protein
LCDAGSWTLRKVDQKYFGSFEVWCWRRMKKFGWTDCVRNEVLQRVKDERNIVHTVTNTKPNWIGHILCRKCFMIYAIEGKKQGGTEVTRRRGKGPSNYWMMFRK